MKRLLFGVSVVFFSFLAGDGFAGNWAHFQHDNAHTGRTDDLVDPSNLELAWSVQAYNRALIVGDTLYARTLAGESTILTAFSLSDGEVKWSYFGQDIYFASVAVAGDLIVLNGFDSGDVFQDTLSVLNRHTGEFLYKLLTPFEYALADPVLARDPKSGGILAIVNGGSYGKLVAFLLDKAGGHHLWKERGDFTAESVPAVIEDSVVVFGVGSGTAVDRVTGAQNVFFVADPGGNGGQPAVYSPQRKDLYVKLDYADLGETRVIAFHYNIQDSIEPLWTRVTRLGQFGGTVAVGQEGNLYSVAGNELAIIDPNDGSTIQSVPYLFGSSPALTRGVVWVSSYTQTFAYDSRTLELIRVFDWLPGGSTGLFVSDTAAINFSNCTPSCNAGVSVYRSQPSLGIR